MKFKVSEKRRYDCRLSVIGRRCLMIGVGELEIRNLRLARPP